MKVAISRFRKNQMKLRQNRLIKETYNYKSNFSKSIEIKRMNSLNYRLRGKQRNFDIHN